MLVAGCGVLEQDWSNPNRGKGQAGVIPGHDIVTLQKSTHSHAAAAVQALEQRKDVVRIEPEAPLASSGFGFLMNNLSGKCIDVIGAPGISPKSKLQLYDCELNGYGPGYTATDQRWEMLAGGYIRNLLSGLCIDVKGAPGIQNQAELQLWHCELSGWGPNYTATDQRWEITSERFIRNSLSGKCIDVKGAPGLNNQLGLQLWDCELSGWGPNYTATDQRWHWNE